MKNITLLLTTTLLSASLIACGEDSTTETTVAVEKTVVPVVDEAPAAIEEAPAADEATEKVESAGEVVYKQYCISCHQADGTGMNGTLAANLSGDPTKLAKSDAELAKSINEGVTGDIGVMPPWGAVINDTQVTDVITYLRTTYGKTPAVDGAKSE